jgi:hypothetical protein
VQIGQVEIKKNDVRDLSGGVFDSSAARGHRLDAGVRKRSHEPRDHFYVGRIVLNVEDTGGVSVAGCGQGWNS